MSYEIIDRPEPYDPGQRARAARTASRAPFNQELYDALKATLNGGAVRLPIPFREPTPARVKGYTIIDKAVDQGVRRRLLDKEGYGLVTERIDDEFCGVWIKPEVLWCSATKQQLVVPEWAERDGVRRRRGNRSPFDPTGVLVISLDKLEEGAS